MPSNYTLTILMTLGAIMALLGFLLINFTDIEHSEFLFDIGLWIIETAGFFLLLVNGTFLQTIYSRIAMGLVAVLIIGAMLKIMHWPYSPEILSVGCIGIVIVYVVSFIKKPVKKRLDFLKVAWVTVSYTGALLLVFHMITREFQILTTVLMILALMDYMLPKIKSKTLFK